MGRGSGPIRSDFRTFHPRSPSWRCPAERLRRSRSRAPQVGPLVLYFLVLRAFFLFRLPVTVLGPSFCSGAPWGHISHLRTFGRFLGRPGQTQSFTRFFLSISSVAGYPQRSDRGKFRVWLGLTLPPPLILAPRRKSLSCGGGPRAT